MSPLQETILELKNRELIMKKGNKKPTGLVTLADAEEMLELLEIKMLNNANRSNQKYIKVFPYSKENVSGLADQRVITPA